MSSPDLSGDIPVDTTEPIEELSPELHRFVFIITSIFLFFWLARVVGRIRSWFDLKLAFEQRNVVRLDGLSSAIREVGAVSRNHLQQLLTARSRYNKIPVTQISLRYHLDPKTVKVIYEMEGAKRLTVQFHLSCDEPVRVQIVYGLQFSAVQALYAARYEGSKKKGRSGSTVRRRPSQGPGVGLAPDAPSASAHDDSGIELSALPEPLPAGGSSLFRQSDTMHSVMGPVFRTADEDVEVLLEVDKLSECLPLGMRAYPLALVLHRFVADTPSADEQKAGVDMSGEWVAELTMIRFLKNKNGDQPEPGKPFIPNIKVDNQLVITPYQLLEMQDIYGIDDSTQLDCSVCLTNPKEVVALPCRHCCVCHQCFDNIRGKCPVCRAQILSFMRFSDSIKPDPVSKSKGKRARPPSSQRHLHP